MFILAMALFAQAGARPPLRCPNTHFAIKGAPAVRLSFAGSTFGTCCDVCPASFIEDPSEAVARATKFGKTIGSFRYDPVSGMSIDGAAAPAYSDYHGIRYFFDREAEKKAFDAKPGRFVEDVKAEAYYCPVTNLATAPDAASFLDYLGVRYFLCGRSCRDSFKADPGKYVSRAAAAVKSLAALKLPERVHE